MKPTLLLFDIDGTLLLSGGCGIPSFERAFEDLFNIPKSWGNTQPDGKTDPVIFNEIATRHLGRPLSEEEYHALAIKYTDYFRKYLPDAKRFRLMPKVQEFLQALKIYPSIFMTIATGNIEPVSLLKLQHGKIISFFATGGYASDDSKRACILNYALQRSNAAFNQNFLPQDCIVIGDTQHDINAARDMGMRSVGLKTGNTRGLDFKHTPPDLLLDSFEEAQTFFDWLGLQ